MRREAWSLVSLEHAVAKSVGSCELEIRRYIAGLGVLAPGVGRAAISASRHPLHETQKPFQRIDIHIQATANGYSEIWPGCEAAFRHRAPLHAESARLDGMA